MVEKEARSAVRLETSVEVCATCVRMHCKQVDYSNSAFRPSREREQ